MVLGYAPGMGWRSGATLAVTAVSTMAMFGCGESAQTTTKAASTAANTSAGSLSEPQAQHRAEVIFERQGLSYYIGVLKPSTVRFSDPCKQAMEGEEGHETPVAGKWHCAGWGLIAIVGGEGKPGECQFVEGEVTSHGLVGKPEGTAETYSESTCQLNLGLGSPGKKPKPALVASWTHKQEAERRHVNELESSPEAQAQKREEAKEEAEEAKRTEEASRVEKGE